MSKINGQTSVFRSPLNPPNPRGVNTDYSDWISAGKAIASELPTPAVPNVAIEVLTEMINMDPRWLHFDEILFCTHQSNPKLGIHGAVLQAALNQLILQGDVVHSDATGRPHYSLAVLKLPNRTPSAWEIDYHKHLERLEPPKDDDDGFPTELDRFGRA